MIGFLFSGPSATGKSTVAKIIGQQLDLPVLGEREILRQISSERGFARTRDWALTVGIEETIDIALNRTIRSIDAARNSRGLILDGCYDQRLTESLRKFFLEDRFIVIGFNASIIERERWMAQRLSSTLEQARKEIQHIDGFKYYAGMAIILKNADINIENDKPLDEIVLELKTKMVDAYPSIKLESAV